MFPFIIINTPTCLAFRINRFNSKRKAYSIGNLFKFVKGFLVGIEFSPVDAIDIYDNVVVNVSLIIVGSDNDLTATPNAFLAKVLAIL